MKEKTAEWVVLWITVLGIVGGGAYLYGHHLGSSAGYKAGTHHQSSADRVQLSDATSALLDLTSQYNTLSDNYNTLRNAVIKYIGTAGSYQPSNHVSCSSTTYGIYDQFTSTDCY